ncbi:RNA-directed DNA polymerase, eukaryota, reverse transcriptase zinc-binding domain protein [Tanacetum coccineum]
MPWTLIPLRPKLVVLQMCLKVKGRLSFARVLVEMGIEKELKNEVIIVYKQQSNCSNITKVVKVEYAWKPWRCSNCVVFGHNDNHCVTKKPQHVDQKEDKTKEFTNVSYANGRKQSYGNKMNNGNEAKQNGTNARIMHKKNNANEVSKDKGKSINDNKVGQNIFFSLNTMDMNDDLGLSTEKMQMMDKYVERKEKPPATVFSTWNVAMIHYFKEKWDASLEIIEEGMEDVMENNSGDGIEMVQNMVHGIAWNIRGMSTSKKQKEIRKLIKDEKLSLCVVLETHIKSTKAKSNSNAIKKEIMEKSSISISNYKGQALDDDGYPLVDGVFLPYLISDHSPRMMTFPNGGKIMKKAFKFANFMAEKKEFISMEDAVKVLEEYNEAMKDEESLLFQKAKVNWMREGDKNNAYFHKVVKEMFHRSRIVSICDEAGVRHENEHVAGQFVDHFQKFLGCTDKVAPFPQDEGLFPTILSTEEAESMIIPVLEKQIKKALFDIDEQKAHGPDGFSTKFFKAAWNIIGKDMCLAVQEFFQTGKLLGEVNATLISLIPKLNTPNKVSDYRPIACCNVIYKCISKILTNRIKRILGKLVDENQCAFIPGRQITDNILLV